MSSDVFMKIMEIVITVVSLLITGFLVPYIKQKIGNEKYAMVEKMVTTYVLATQQLYKEMSGEEKLDIVTNKISAFLIENRIDISNDQIRQLIESAVKQMKMNVTAI